MVSIDKIISEVDSNRSFIIEAQKHLHRIPELCHQEHLTTAYINEVLIKNGIEILDLGLPTGTVGIIRGAFDGPTVALRADIDGLPVTEDDSHEVISGHIGTMHACGHDWHTASLIGAALALNTHRAEICGNIILIFQPAEESVTGALQVIDTGLFEKYNIDCVFGQHVRPDINSGKIGLRIGTIMSAKDSFDIVVKGKGGHGAAPENAIDPIVAASALVMAVQSIVSRNISPRENAVVSICTFNADGSTNIIPDTVHLMGSIRSCSEEARKTALHRLESITDSVLHGYGCDYSFKYIENIPITANDSSLYPLALESAAHVFDKDNIFSQNVDMVSEDFSFYASHAPTFFYFLGSGIHGTNNAPLHNPNFLAAPETAILGAKLLVSSAISYIINSIK